MRVAELEQSSWKVQMRLNFTHQNHQQRLWFVLPVFCCLSSAAPGHLEEVHADFMSSPNSWCGRCDAEGRAGSFQLLMRATSL